MLCIIVRSNASFLCRHEDTNSLRLLSDDSSGWRRINNFSLRQGLHLMIALL